MSGKHWNTAVTSACLGVLSIAMATLAGSGDFDDDGNGYVDLRDHSSFKSCLEDSGPGKAPASQECTEVFDGDTDGDVDLADFAAFQRAHGHLPIPLRDTSGSILTVTSTAPYSARQTCGVNACHDLDIIANGSHHQQGRTDTVGDIIMHDDFYGDGRWWVRGSGVYGRWSGGSGGMNRQTAGKNNTNESVMDMTAFYSAGKCGGCHVGGGGMEFDRSGQRLYGYYEDTGRFQFGYERLGLTADDVVLDGDYAFLDDTDGSLSPAPWNDTGVAEPECLHCHRTGRTWSDEKDMHREWRAAVLATTTELVDAMENPVPAFAAAGTAGQGWFSTLNTDANPPVLQIDYSVGVTDGSLIRNPDDTLSLPETTLTSIPGDRVCWGCHLPGGAEDKRGMVWFDERDVHFKKLTNRSDEDPGNDITDENARTCTHCHTGDLDHNYTKGNSPYTQFRNELDWVGFKSCRECHLSILPDNSLNPDKDPDAPEVPGNLTVHITGFFEDDDERGMARSLSCQACHMPYALERGVLVTDWSLTGTAVQYHTDEFLSSDPRNPSDADKSKWYPALRRKMDSDGLERFFPQKMEIAIYWADWDQNATPLTTVDDTIQPIILWRLRYITGNAPLSGVEDDNGDGKLEVNRPDEMLLYMQALKGNDPYDEPVANNPVLVKGPRVWYEDGQAPGGVNWFDSEESGIAVEPFEIYGLDHNVLPATESWGIGELPIACTICHDVIEPYESPFIDRLILIDPFDVNGEPVYRVNRTTGLNPIY